jgi:hypothetical protein
MNHRQLKRDLRQGCTIQSSTAPELFAPGTGYLQPAQPQAFDFHRKRLTEFNGDAPRKFVQGLLAPKSPKSARSPPSAKMADVIRFSDHEPRYRLAVRQEESALIIVLPVIRIERYADPAPPERKRQRKRLRRHIGKTED